MGTPLPQAITNQLRLLLTDGASIPNLCYYVQYGHYDSNIRKPLTSFRLDFSMHGSWATTLALSIVCIDTSTTRCITEINYTINMLHSTLLSFTPILELTKKLLLP